MNALPVTICVPAYNAASHLVETLESAAAQDWPEIRILVSVDKSDDETADIAARFAAARFASAHGAHVVAHDRRLGWRRNCNFALASAPTRHAMILPHDDLLQPGYVSACMAALAGEPGGVAAYSDLACFGDREFTFVWRPLAGGAAERVIHYVARSMSAVPFRAVIDTEKSGGVPIPKTISDFAADTVWCARLAARGQMIRVPEPLYRKRLHGNATHSRWWVEAREFAEEWAVHTVEIVDAALSELPELAENPAFWKAVRRRLRMTTRVWGRDLDWLTRMRLDSRRFRGALEVYRRVAARRPHYSWAQKR